MKSLQEIQERIIGTKIRINNLKRKYKEDEYMSDEYYYLELDILKTELRCLEWVVEDSKQEQEKVQVKEDIKGQPIYADETLVRFNLESPVEDVDTLVLEGVFTYNDDELRYEIDMLEKYEEMYSIICLSYNCMTMSNFEVVK